MYTVINVMGLAAGMTVAMLIAFWIWDEVTYDKSFTNHQQLAQVMTNNLGDDGTLSTCPMFACRLPGSCVVNTAVILKMLLWHVELGTRIDRGR